MIGAHLRTWHHQANQPRLEVTRHCSRRGCPVSTRNYVIIDQKPYCEICAPRFDNTVTPDGLAQRRVEEDRRTAELVREWNVLGTVDYRHVTPRDCKLWREMRKTRTLQQIADECGRSIDTIGNHTRGNCKH